MSCADPAILEAYQHVRVGVDARRGERGCKAAITEFARHVGLCERRVHGLYYQQVKRLWADEYLLLRQKAREWQLAEIARQEAKIALLKAQYEALEGEL